MACSDGGFGGKIAVSPRRKASHEFVIAPVKIHEVIHEEAGNEFFPITHAHTQTHIQTHNRHTYRHIYIQTQ